MDESNLIRCLMQRASLLPEVEGFVSGTQSMTFAEMNRRTSQFANALRSLDIRPGSRVAILTRNQVECALWAGHERSIQ